MRPSKPPASASSGCELVPQGPDRQPRRDRLPHHPHRAAHRHRTVAVYSEADWGALHVALADEAWRSGRRPPRESYLARTDRRAARRAAPKRSIPATASCPRTPVSREACADAGHRFIGPPPAAIAAMGSKTAAKALMARPACRWCRAITATTRTPRFLERSRAHRLSGADQGRRPAAAGKGMRVVDERGEFAAALDAAPSARREPPSATPAC